MEKDPLQVSLKFLDITGKDSELCFSLEEASLPNLHWKSADHSETSALQEKKGANNSGSDCDVETKEQKNRS